MAPYDTPVPGVAGYGEAALLAKRAYQNALASFNQRRSQAGRQYGYNFEVNADTGAMGKMTVDPNNPYGHFQEMLRTHAEQGQGLEDQAQERGIKGGLANQLRSRGQLNYGRDAAALGSSLTGLLGGIQGEQNQAAYTRDSALWEAERNAARDAIQNQAFNTPDYTGAQYPTYADAAAQAAPVVAAAAKPSDTARWAGQNMTQAKLIQQLVAKGVKPSTWAKNHPAAAKALGISPKLNANNAIIKKAMGRVK